MQNLSQGLGFVVAYLCLGGHAGDEEHSELWPCVWLVRSWSSELHRGACIAHLSHRDHCVQTAASVACKRSSEMGPGAHNMTFPAKSWKGLAHIIALQKLLMLIAQVATLWSSQLFWALMNRNYFLIIKPSYTWNKENKTSQGSMVYPVEQQRKPIYFIQWTV